MVTRFGLRKIISLGYSVTEGTQDRCQDDGQVGNGYRFLWVSDGLAEIGCQILYGLSVVKQFSQWYPVVANGNLVWAEKNYKPGIFGHQGNPRPIPRRWSIWQWVPIPSGL